MRRVFSGVLIAIGVAIQYAPAQVPSQEQCQQADDQLNQVYQQLRGALNDAQKQQLKQAQREWIKQRDAFVAQNYGNPQEALYQVTMQRVQQLNGIVFNNSKVTKQNPSEYKRAINNNEIIPVVQINAKIPKCVSISNNGDFIASGTDGLVSIWLKDGALIKTIKTDGNELLNIKIYTDQDKLAVLENFHREGLFLTVYSISTGEKNGKFEIIGKNNDADVSYFTQDGNHLIVTGSKAENLYYVYNLRELLDELNASSILLIKPNQVFNEDKLRINYPELSDKSERALMFASGFEGVLSGQDDRSTKKEHTIYKDKKFDVGSFLEYWTFRNLQTGNNTKFNLTSKVSDFFSDGLLVSRDGSKTAEYSGNKLKIYDNKFLDFSQFQIPVNFIRSACFSPDGKDIVIYGDNDERDALKYAQEKTPSSDSRIIVINLRSGIIVEKKVLAAEFLDRFDLYHSGIRWIKQGIFLKGFGIFDSSLNKKADFPNHACFPVSILDPEVLGRLYSNEPMKILDLTIISADSLQALKTIPYDSKNTTAFQRLAPFDLDLTKRSVLKTWRTVPGAGGMFLSSADQSINFNEIVGQKCPTFASFLTNGLILAEASPMLTSDKLLIINPLNNVNPLFSIEVPHVRDVCLSKDTKCLFGIENDNSIVRYDIKNNKIKPIIRYLSNNDSLLAITPEYYYITHGQSYRLLRFTRGLNSFPLEQFDLRLNRPDIVLERLGAPKEAIETAKSLRDKRLKRMGVTEEMLKPDFHLPELQIAGDIPATTSKDQLDLQIKATDDKYPLDRLRVYVNNVPVNGRDGELLRDQKCQSLEKTIPIKLAAGRNKIQVSVLNSAGAESLYANAEVTCTAERPKPKLYAVALGVSQYDRPEWCLKYAAKDATDLIGKLKEKAGSSYSEVKPLLLTDKDVIKESAAKIKEFLSRATIDDTVLIFMAGHGILDDKYDYYFGTTDIDPAKPSERGMPYEAIDTILAEVPSLKKALLMDTCHAGELDDDEKKELAASDGSSSPAGIPAADTNSSPLAGKVAMRSIGTRGMQVKAVEGAKGKSDWYEKLQDMFVDLRRGSGATVISSSQGAEYAFESSEQSNGLFTYALMEALDGKATPNKDGQITISTVGDYVKKRVQDLTKGKQNPNLRGVNLEEDFSLGAAK